MLAASMANKDGYYEIRIPKELIKKTDIQKAFDFLNISIIAKKSKATKKQIDKLSKEINSSFWSKNKEKLLNETGG